MLQKRGSVTHDDNFFSSAARNVTEFGRYFRAVCTMLSITSLSSIARASGIPQSTLWTWANDGNRPRTMAILERLLDGLRTYEEWREDPWARDLTNLASHVTPEQWTQALADLHVLESEVQHNNNNNTHE